MEETKIIIVDKIQDLNFIFDEDKDVNLRFIVKEGILCNLNVFTNSNANQNVEIELEKNAILNHNCITINTQKFYCKVNQDENSKYENYSVNFASNQHFETNNSADLNGKKSYSNIKIINVANKSSNIQSTGLICIKKESIGSVGHQKFEGIILDEKSSIDARPNLEVYNDDVTCSHGASITQIDDDKLFYLNSKGLNRKQAVNLVVLGYFDSILFRMNNKFALNIRHRLENRNII